MLLVGVETAELSTDADDAEEGNGKDRVLPPLVEEMGVLPPLPEEAVGLGFDTDNPAIRLDTVNTLNLCCCKERIVILYGL
jgi:hypothetical protein